MITRLHNIVFLCMHNTTRQEDLQDFVNDLLADGLLVNSLFTEDITVVLINSKSDDKRFNEDGGMTKGWEWMRGGSSSLLA